MTISSIEPNKILIILKYEEAHLLRDSNLDKKKDYSPAAIAYFLSLAAVKSGVPLFGKKISVFSYNGKDNVYLVVTICPQRCLPAGDFSHFFVRFVSHDALFSGVDVISHCLISDSILYKYNNSYILTIRIDPEQTEKIRWLLSEYGTVRPWTPLLSARLDEYGTPLIKHSAIEILNKRI